MQLQSTVDSIETATDARWQLLAALLLVSTPWPVLVAIEVGFIAWAVWSRGGES